MSLKTKFDLHNIFIADDDADDRSFFAEALEEVNPNVLLTEFEDGLQLMNLLSKPDQILSDVLFLDINMSKQSGIECLEIIRNDKNSRLASIPIVILSTSSNPETIQKAYNLGASYYAVKLSSFNEIIFFLNTIVDVNWPLRIPDLVTFRLI